MATPSLTTPDTGLATTLRVSSRDLGALQIHDPDHPERRVVAAGAPWFMALFGRDSLLTSWMALPLDQQLAHGTLQTLARFQGTQEDPLTEEQPGRILHEVRLGREAALALGGGRAYYGTADATPLFVALLGELHRWGLPRADVLALLPAADRALEWVRGYGDLDGDGFVEYRRATDRGLVNQGWKDSFDGVNDAAGRLGSPPIALAEVQAYVYAAYRARASIACSLGDPATAAACAERAASLKADFNERFWLPERGWYAMALDGDKRPLDALASNMGHCLWCRDRRRRQGGGSGRAPGGRTLWSGFGRADAGHDDGRLQPDELPQRLGLAARHRDRRRRARPLRVRRGGAAGRRSACWTPLRRSAAGCPSCSVASTATEFAVPVSYPTSCSPQAWAAAAPVLVLRALLGFEPDLPAGRVGFAPAVPERMCPMRIEHIPLGPARVTVEVERDGARIQGLPDGVVAGPPA